MKNTTERGEFRILIYRGAEGYVGICYEGSFVVVGETLQETQDHIMNGLIALLQTIKDGNLSEQAINQKPEFKYRFLFFVLPIISSVARWLEISFFTKPITPGLLGNYIA